MNGLRIIKEPIVAMSREDDIFAAKAIAGCTHLGGEDLDKRIADLSEVAKSIGNCNHLTSPRQIDRLVSKVEKCLAEDELNREVERLHEKLEAEDDEDIDTAAQEIFDWMHANHANQWTEEEAV